MLEERIALVMSSDNQYNGNLYVGGYDSLKMVPEKGIGAVLSAVWTGHFKPDEKLKYLLIEADDAPTYDMSKHFEKAVKFIHESLQTTNVLVHCAAGISRSVCLIIAYMIKIHKMKPQDALTKIRQTRPWAGPNVGFTEQLEKYYKEVMEEKQ
ncbi:unnamed protein product [Paramecium octaurelia]|uniref:Uncharacterized protein n=1 Tax=Paramecium octaurelia TaxID=43137 RepID=A0A8S1S9C2_PAROT|nr:unnamed protein product [Paramecium octaurelia]